MRPKVAWFRHSHARRRLQIAGVRHPGQHLPSGVGPLPVPSAKTIRLDLDPFSTPSPQHQQPGLGPSAPFRQNLAPGLGPLSTPSRQHLQPGVGLPIAPLRQNLLPHLGALLATPAEEETVSRRWRRIVVNAARWHNHTVRFSRGVQEPGILGHVLAKGTKKLFVGQGCKFQKPIFVEKPPHGGYQLEALTVDTLALDSGLHLLLKCCRNLKEVRLRISAMTQGILSGLLRNEQLEEFELNTFRGCTFDQLMAIVRNCRRLTRWRSEGISPLSAKQLAAFVQELPETLQDFALAPDFNNTAHDEHVETLVRSCPNIEHLDLNGCKELTAASIDHLRSLPKLQSLDVSLCHGLPLESLQRVQSLASLRTLDVSRYLLSFDDICKLRNALPAVRVRTNEPE